VNVARAPEPEREPVPRGRHVRAALVGGFLAWLPLALGGQLLAWTAYALTRSFRPWSWVKVGLLNSLVVARVPFEARADPPQAVAVEPSLFTTSMLVSIALGAGTIVALVLLFRAGRAAGSGQTQLRSALLAGVGVGIGFAVPMGASALLVTLRFPSIGIGVLRPVVWQAFVVPFVLGVVAGSVGALGASSGPWRTGAAGRRVVAAWRGAWHALTWGFLLALLGTVALAALEPAASTGYARALEGERSGGAVLAMYHALLLPNQSIDVLAISMGSCTEFVLGEGTSRLCLGGLDVGDALTGLVAGLPSSDGSRHVPFGPGYLLFLLVPALATVAGGRRAAEGVRRIGERMLRATWSGAMFGLLVGIAAWAASISFVGDGGTIASLGADPVGTGALGIVWGVAGGAIGAVLPDRAGTPPEPPLRRQDPEGLPSETSLK
jgi:hypothetical protein